MQSHIYTVQIQFADERGAKSCHSVEIADPGAKTGLMEPD
jgi:hypothetical protein